MTIMNQLRKWSWGLSLGLVGLAGALVPLSSAFATRPAMVGGMHLAAVVPTAGPGTACIGTQAYFAIPSTPGAPIDIANALPLLSFDALSFVVRPSPTTEGLFANLTTGMKYSEVDVLFVGISGGVQTACRTIRL